MVTWAVGGRTAHCQPPAFATNAIHNVASLMRALVASSFVSFLGGADVAVPCRNARCDKRHTDWELEFAATNGKMLHARHGSCTVRWNVFGLPTHSTDPPQDIISGILEFTTLKTPDWSTARQFLPCDIMFVFASELVKQPPT